MIEYRNFTTILSDPWGLQTDLGNSVGIKAISRNISVMFFLKLRG